MAKKVANKEGKKGTRKISVAKAINELFDDRGVDEVSFEKAERVAKGVKSDTAFNATHFSWYKNQYRKAHGIKSPRAKADKKNNKKGKNKD